MSFFFSNNADITIDLDEVVRGQPKAVASSKTPSPSESPTPTQTLNKRDSLKVSNIPSTKKGMPLYMDGDTVKGNVHIAVKPGKKFEHLGIKIEFFGAVEIFNDQSSSLEFSQLVRELATPGELMTSATFPFEFNKVEKQYESFEGQYVRLRYFLRVTITKRFNSQVKEQNLWVHTLQDRVDNNHNIKMEVGIEDSLHIEFEYQRSKYHLKDVIIGKIYFIIVGVKIKHMELGIIRRETVGRGSKVTVDNKTIAKFEIMDGQPVKGECIPIRLFLAGYDLSPTMRDICKRFSVKYHLNLVLVDEDDRRYFKQQEITLWRK